MITRELTEANREECFKRIRAINEKVEKLDNERFGIMKLLMEVFNYRDWDALRANYNDWYGKV